MINEKLLEVLCCPETKQRLSLLDNKALDAVNHKIAAGALSTRNGEQLRDPIDAGLIREDRSFIYPIKKGVPIMVIGESIPGEAIEE